MIMYDGREIQLAECHRASIYSLQDEPISEALVYFVGEELRLVFDDDCYDQLDAEERIVFYDGYLGLVTCRCTLYSYRFERNELYEVRYGACCTIIQVERIQQRRADCKVKLSVPFNIDHGGGEFIPAVAADISAGGIGFFSTHIFREGEKVRFSLILGDKSLDLVAEILYRVESREEDNRELRYGCRFVNLRMGVEASIRQYVYQRQRKQRRGDIR